MPKKGFNYAVSGIIIIANGGWVRGSEMAVYDSPMCKTNVNQRSCEGVFLFAILGLKQ